MRDHGGNLDAAIDAFGGTRDEWIDLSTGINPRPYPIPQISSHAWNALPTKADIGALIDQARASFPTNAACLPTAGAQAGIQMIPHVLPKGVARVISPTYNEHAASLKSAGWEVAEVSNLSELEGAKLGVIVNPNNPDGSMYSPEKILGISESVGNLIVDESFCDPHPEISVTPHIENRGNITVLRSFGKFYGLAGIRLGFVFGSQIIINTLSERSGPWPVSGPAIEIGARALADKVWQQATVERLKSDTDRIDAMATKAGWSVAGGTTLFRLYETQNAEDAQRKLAENHIWSRIFPYSDKWIRLGLTDGQVNWDRLETALTSQT